MLEQKLYCSVSFLSGKYLGLKCFNNCSREFVFLKLHSGSVLVIFERSRFLTAVNTVAADC